MAGTTPAGERLQTFLDDLVAAGELSAAVGMVGGVEGIAWSGVAGEARPGRATTLATRFDYGSITKPFLATLALVLDAAGELPLATPIGEAFGPADHVHPVLARRTLADLLCHRSGLTGWVPFYHLCREPAEAPALLLNGSLLETRFDTYSDPGYDLWTLAAQRLLGRPLEPVLRERVLGPLGLTGVEVAPGDQADIAVCYCDTAEEVRLAAARGLTIDLLPPPPPGVPNDGNARFLGGLPGHAGLFGPAEALFLLGMEWLRSGALLTPEGVARARDCDGRFALGWWRRQVRGGGGPDLAPSAFGHTGFPGGNLWVDPEAGRVLVLLAHRTSAVVPGTRALNRRRRRFHALAYHRNPR